MLLVGMLFVLLVLGPVVILGVMALASNERAMARLRRLPSRLSHSGERCRQGTGPML